MPGISVAPAQCAEAERGDTETRKRCVVASSTRRPAGRSVADLRLPRLRQLRQPLPEMIRRVAEPRATDLNNAPCSVVLIEQDMNPLDYLRMILGECSRAVRALLLGCQVSFDTRTPGIGIYELQDAHCLHHHERACSIIRCSRRAVPRVEMR